MLAGGMSIKAEIAVVVLFTLLLTLPFINRPFHMDDAGFLELARARQTDPTALTLTDYTFFGQENELFLDTHPPLISSYLAFLINLAGAESEPVLHAGFLAFPLIAAVAMYFLARRYTNYAMLAAMLLMATPGMMVMSHGLMSDVPGVAFWLSGVTLYVYGLQRRSQGMMALCGLVITIGVFTSYQVLSVIPLLLAYVVLRRKLSLLSILPFALPISAFLSYAVWHLAVIGDLPRFSYGVGEPMAWHSIVQKGASATMIVAGAVIFIGVVMRVLLARKWDFTVYQFLLAPLWVAILFQYFYGGYGTAAAVMTIVLMPLGMLMLYRLFADAWSRIRQAWQFGRERPAEDLLLVLWLAGVLFYVTVILPYASVRYLLPLFPPLILFFIRLAGERFSQSPEVLRNILWTGVFTTAVMGLLLASADYHLASVNKEFAGRDAAGIGMETAAGGGRLWYVGEFGFRYYMEQQGFTQLPEDTEVPAGDVIIQSPLADPRLFSDELKDKVKLVETISYGSVLPIRVTSFAAHAGFYGHFWGLLPFSLASGNVEEFLVYEVVPPQKGHIESLLDRLSGKRESSLEVENG